MESTGKGRAQKRLLLFLNLLFIAYALLLIRITLFKQAPLYHLLAAVGASERTVNLVPFRSVTELMAQNAPLSRILENAAGNVALFVPLGLLLPALTKRTPGQVILCGACISLSIELVQYVLALGGTDIDDLLFNTAGTALGWLCYHLIGRVFEAGPRRLAAVAAAAAALGLCGLMGLAATHAELLLPFPKTVVLENDALVEAFIDTPSALNGRLAGVDGGTLTVEKSVHSADEARVLASMALTDESRYFVCHAETTCFFDAVIEERYRYERLSCEPPADGALSDYLGCNLRVWSADGRQIDALVIILET